MIIKCDDEELLNIDELTLKLFAHDVIDPIEDIKRRLKWVIEHKCDQIYGRLETEWLPILRKENISIPTEKKSLCEMIFSMTNYKNRLERDQL